MGPFTSLVKQVPEGCGQYFNRRLRYRSLATCSWSVGGRIWARAKRSIDLDWGDTFEHGLSHQSQGFPEFLLPCGEVVIGDPNPRVSIVHHPGHAKGLESCGFGLEADMPLVVKGTRKASPALHGQGGSLGNFPLVASPNLHPGP